VLFWAVVSDSTEEAVELFPSREEAEAIVQAWDRDEPDWRWMLHVDSGTGLERPCELLVAWAREA
jgi:hypothetical protein